MNSGFQYVDPNDPNGCKKKHFYRDTDGTVAIMVFEAPWNGADTDSTGNSPRSELRQTYADGSEHNWTPSAEGGTHSLQASCAVNSGDSKVIIGQIHAETPIPPGGSTGVPAIVLDYTAGAIRLTVKRSPNDRINDTTYDFPGPFALGAQINYTLQLVGTGTSVKLYATVNGQKPRLNGVPQDFVDMYATDPAWADVNTTLYFKAGSYYPDNVGTGTAKVTFSSLSVTPATP